MVDPWKYVVGFVCLEEGDPVVNEFPTDDERNDDSDASCYPERIAITFGHVRLMKQDIWPMHGDNLQEVYLRLVTDEEGAKYYAYRDDSYGYSAKLWSITLTAVQNPELIPFMSWL